MEEKVLTSDSIESLSRMYSELIDLAITTNSNHYDYLVSKADEFLDWICEEVEIYLEDVK